jgi:hypothetical protein
MHTFKDSLDLIRASIDEEVSFPNNMQQPQQNIEAQLSQFLQVASHRLLQSSSREMRDTVATHSRVVVLSEEVHTDDVVAFQFSTVSALVVKNLMEISMQLKILNDAKCYQKKLTFLREALNRPIAPPCFKLLLTDTHSAAA